MKFSTEPIVEESTLDINITPLIDIVFLLLIFFMISTTFVESHGIQVKLPSSSATLTKDAPKDIVVSMNAKGAVFVKDKELDLKELASEFSRLSKQTESLTLVLRADKNASHGNVVKVLDLAKSSGVARIAVATSPQTKLE